MASVNATEGRRDRARLEALTGLRLFAALAVYLSHLQPPSGAPPFVATFLASGYMGVTLFFTLSGFVLALNYASRLRRPTVAGLRDYAVARFARVYPLYILVLLYILTRQQALDGGITGWWKHVLAIQAWDPNLQVAYAFNGPGWSIGVEFFMYACFPLLIPLLGRLQKPRATMLAAAAVALAMVAITAWFTSTGRGDLPWADPGSAHRWLYRMPLTRLGDFMLGILAALLYVQVRDRSAAKRLGSALALAAVAVIVALMAWPAHLYTAWSWDVSYALPSAALIFGLAIAPASRFAKALALPIVVLLGEASYAFYLVHQPAIGFFGAGRWAFDVSVTTLVFELLTLGAILCLAVGLHVLVERPARVRIREWSGRLSRRRSRRPELASDPAALL